MKISHLELFWPIFDNVVDYAKSTRKLVNLLILPKYSQNWQVYCWVSLETLFLRTQTRFWTFSALLRQFCYLWDLRCSRRQKKVLQRPPQSKLHIILILGSKFPLDIIFVDLKPPAPKIQRRVENIRKQLSFLSSASYWEKLSAILTLGKKLNFGTINIFF